MLCIHLVSMTDNHLAIAKSLTDNSKIFKHSSDIIDYHNYTVTIMRLYKSINRAVYVCIVRVACYVLFITDSY